MTIGLYRTITLRKENGKNVIEFVQNFEIEALLSKYDHRA